MPMYDFRCQTCGWTNEVFRKKFDEHETLPCPCKGEMVRVIVGGTAEVPQRRGVVGDDIPGGIEIKHGLCNADGTPKKFYSKTEIRREAARRGLSVGYDDNVHKGVRGSDKNPHTRRWV